MNSIKNYLIIFAVVSIACLYAGSYNIAHLLQQAHNTREGVDQIRFLKPILDPSNGATPEQIAEAKSFPILKNR